MTSAKPEDVNAAEGDVTFLAEGEWDTYKDDPLAVEVKEKAEKKIIALHERIRALDAEMIDVKVKNGIFPAELQCCPIDTNRLTNFLCPPAQSICLLNWKANLRR